MSRLLRAFLAEKPGGAANILQRFEVYIQRESATKPGDLSALATLLAKRPREAEALLFAESSEQASGASGSSLHGKKLSPLVSECLRRVAASAVPRLTAGDFTPNEVAELLHALSRAPSPELRAGLQSGGGLAVQAAVATLGPRGLTLVANAYARLHLRDVPVLRSIAHRGTEVVKEADAQALAGLAHAFAKTQTYHHKLFSALKGRLPEVVEDMAPAEVVSCLFAFARSLPPSDKMDPLVFAFESPRGFKHIFEALLARFRILLKGATLSKETALLALHAVDILQLREERLLVGLFAPLHWQSLAPSELCTALHAAARLGAGPLGGPESLGLSGLAAARGQQLCILTSALTLLVYQAGCIRTAGGMPRPWRWDRHALHTWPQLLGDASAVALGHVAAERALPDQDQEQEHRTVAAPHVALACLLLLPPFAGCLGKYTTLRNARRLLQFGQFMHSARASRLASGNLTTSELQVAVEVALRRISIVEGRPLPTQAEVHALPFWLDIVVGPTSAVHHCS